MSEHSLCEIWINKQNLAETRVENTILNSDALTDGQVMLKVESFGFSANNITYALLGDRMAYWGFFPAADGWGILPVWGFATVEASCHPDVEVGEKVFGYLPFASHLVIQADRVNPQGFYDAHPQRKSISPVYDHYVRCSNDPGYSPDKEAWQLNYRPLFMTSFVLDDYVGEQVDDSVDTVVLTSASSKTAYGAAYLLKQYREKRGQKYRVVGLTSSGNMEFVEQSGCYDEVVSYDDAQSYDYGSGCWVLDFAGNKKLLLSIEARLAEVPHKFVFIGATDVQAAASKQEGEVDGELFFAPSQVKKRTEEWGGQGFLMRYAEAWMGFSKHIEPLISQHDFEGVDALVELYKQGLAGNFDTRAMNVVRF